STSMGRHQVMLSSSTPLLRYSLIPSRTTVTTLNTVSIANYRCGPGEKLLLIAGPCVIESAELTLSIADRLREIAAERQVQLVFKASFDKANRTSASAYRGLGMDEGLRVLEQVKRNTGLPV